MLCEAIPVLCLILRIQIEFNKFTIIMLRVVKDIRRGFTLNCIKIPKLLRSKNHDTDGRKGENHVKSGMAC
jgi:hypothetical protein